MSMGKVRVKMCGFTREEDITAAVEHGADAIGFVFYASSKRFVSLEQAAALRRHVPAFVSVVALFVNPEPRYVKDVLKVVQPNLLQFHGDESVAFCESFAHPYLKAFRVGGPHSSSARAVWEQCKDYQSASGWLFDSFSPAYGGTGVRFDTALLNEVHKQPTARPVILAGGLDALNVGAAIQDVRPFAVDVSSGIEQAPGEKSSLRMQAFMQQCNLYC